MSDQPAVALGPVPLAPGPVGVTVPATSANLGPGFDCLGLALDLRDELRAELLDGGDDRVEIEVTGEGAGEVPQDRTHLVVRAMDATFARAGVDPPGLRLRCRNRIPHSRGLGSSSAAIVAGIALANALLPERARADDTAMLRLANAIEGHPDNVAPALLGGFVVSGQDDEDVWARRVPLASGLGAVALVPPEGVRTEVARGLLPATVPHAAAAANSGRTALLVAALTGAPELLLRATEDFLHQSYRRPAMPASLDLVEQLRARGVPAVVSGAGPTVLALTGLGLPAAGATTTMAPAGWRVQQLALSDRGVTAA